jgi:LPXTG-site transpeptidase (sortase) family protein
VNLHSSALRFTQRLFLWFGVGALAYAGGAIAYASIYQSYQSWKFGQVVVAPKVIRAALVEETPAFHDGDIVGKLKIPRIGISVMVLQGMEETALILGAGHVPGTPSPGADGNVVIAAHRDTFFRKLEGIRPGDSIQITTVRGIFEYKVDSTEIVDPADTEPMESRDHPELTLITCFPFYFVGSAPKRFIVHALPLK